MNILIPADTCTLRILNINPPFVPSVYPKYSRITRIEYLHTTLTTFDGKIVMVGYREMKVMIEDRKRRLIRTQNLLKLMKYDLEADDHAPRSTRQLEWSDIPGSKKILGEF
jgi:hypothetical protein